MILAGAEQTLRKSNHTRKCLVTYPPGRSDSLEAESRLILTGAAIAMKFLKRDLATDLLTDDQLKALGVISVECSAIEEYVNHLLPVAAGTSYESAIILLGAGTNLGRKLEMLQELAILNFTGAKREEFVSALAMAKKAIADRSILLHGVWQHTGNMLKEILSGVPNKPGDAVVVNKRKPKQMPVKAAEVLQIAWEVSRAQLAIHDLWAEYVIRPAVLEGAKMVDDAHRAVVKG